MPKPCTQLLAQILLIADGAAVCLAKSCFAKIRRTSPVARAASCADVSVGFHPTFGGGLPFSQASALHIFQPAACKLRHRGYLADCVALRAASQNRKKPEKNTG